MNNEDEYLNQVSIELCKRDFYYFLQTFWDITIPEEPIYNWHVEYLCKELQLCAERVFRGDVNPYDLLINIPPGTTKTTITIIMFPVWVWLRMPEARILTLNYSAKGAEDKAVFSKDIIKSDRFKAMFPDMVIRQDIDNKAMFKNIQGGERVSKGIKGSVLSGHYHFILADDPLNITEAESKLKREYTNSMLTKIAATRKVDKDTAFTCYIQQRLNEDDPSGMLLAKEGIKLKHINLPAEDNGKIKPPYLKVKYEDGLLDPIRLSRNTLNDLRIALGSYDYAGQFMQEPAPDDGGMIKKHWFKTIPMEELRVMTGESLTWNFEVDGAFTSNTKNDQSAILAWAYHDNQMYIREVLGVWQEVNDFISTLNNFVFANGYNRNSRVYIENKASGIVFLQALRRNSNLNVISEEPKGSKEERVKLCLPFLESGRCTLVDGAWNEDFISQCGMFPRAKLKDKVDCLTSAINKITSDTGRIQNISFN